MIPTKEEYKKRRDLWYQALRSGKFARGEGYLCNITQEGLAQFCCLGVACEVYSDHSGSPLERDDVNEFGFGVQGYKTKRELYYTQYLPDDVIEWFGFNAEDPGFMLSIGLVELNDENHKSFVEIADIVSQNETNYFNPNVL